MALCCFALLIQLMSLACLYTKQRAGLYACQKQSSLDLNVISAAKEIIEQNQFVSRCNRPEEERIKEKHVKYKNIDLYFKDGRTFLNCSCQKKKEWYVYTIYYDDHAIVSMEVQKK